MGLITTIVVGAIAGWLTSLVMKTKTGLITNLILGVIGGFLGGWLSSILLGVDLVNGFNLTSIVVSVIGAILVVVLYRFIRRK